MLKGKFAVLALVAAALLCWQVAGVDTVNSGIVHPCNSTASSASGAVLACPQSDGNPLSGAGVTISVTIKDNTNAPIAGIPAGDFWLIGCADLLVLCGGSGSIDATAATDAAGMTTIAGDITAGGCDTGVRVVCQGIVLGSGGGCPTLCLPIGVRSPDSTKDLLVSAADFAAFGLAYASPPKPYQACFDFVGGPFGTISAADFAAFGLHYNHKC